MHACLASRHESRSLHKLRSLYIDAFPKGKSLLVFDFSNSGSEGLSRFSELANDSVMPAKAKT